MKNIAEMYTGFDQDCLDPDLEGLNNQFDQVIRNIPDSIVRAGDDYVMPPEFSRDPLTPLQALRDEKGYVVRGDNGNFGGVQLPNTFGLDYSIPHYCVMGVAEMDEILMNDDVFRNKGAYGLQGEATGVAHGESKGTIPTVEDDELHDELRYIYNTVLNHKTMGQRSENLISPICNWLIERMKAKLENGEEVCLCRDISLPLTFKAMTTMLGIGTDRMPEFIDYGDKVLNAALDPKEGLIAADKLYDFWLDEVKAHKLNPRNDLLMYLLKVEREGQRALSDEEIAITARFILGGGIDTTWRGLVLALYTLLSHVDQYKAVCETPKKLIRPAVEEALRFAPSGFVVPRLVSQDMVVGDTEIPKGSHITMLQGVANRDPRRWEKPDEFDIFRKFKTHRTFSGGTHACAGQHLARLEIHTVLSLFCEQLPNLRLAVAPDEVEVRGFGIRAPLRVPVVLT